MSPLRFARGRQRSQALVEFAFALPVFVVLVLFTIQVGLIFIAYYSETEMARETARWLSVNSASTDDTELATHVQQTMLPGLNGGTTPPTVTSGTNTASPGGDSVAVVGSMTVRYTPCLPDSNNLCKGPTPPSPANPLLTQRLSGSTLFVQMQYDVSNLIFLPTSFRFGSLITSVPTSLPPYKVTVLVE